MNFYAFHIGDYASATRHLSWDEDAAYRRMLDVYYTTEQPLPTDLRSVCRLVMAQTDAQREAVKVVLEEFFVSTENGWINPRADEEIERTCSKREKARASADARWKQSQSERNANAMRTHTESDANASKSDAKAMLPIPLPITQEEPPIVPLPGDDGPSGFDEFWQTYPRKVGKGAAMTAWKRAKVNGHLADVLAAVGRQRLSEQWQRDNGRFVPNPATWLNQRRWEDEAGEGAAPAKLKPGEKATADGWVYI